MDKIMRIFRRTSFPNAIRYLLLLVSRKLLFPNAKISFSEFAEDLILINSFKLKDQGVFVDVGSNMPITNSVTFQLYMKGWSGINIDGNSDLIKTYFSNRSKDYSVCELIDETEKEVEFIKFSGHALNTISSSQVFDWNKDQIIGKEKRITKRLSTVLESYWPEGKGIDLLTIDVEGMDLAVLKSHDFQKFPAKIIVVEMHGFNIMRPGDNSIFNYLISKGYILKAFSGLNGYFISKAENY
jgi:FkbM family methyltransferase